MTYAFDTLGGMEADDTVAPSQLADDLMGRGQHFITSEEAAARLGVDVNAVPRSLRRARQAGKFVSVTKGGWVPVPPEYRATGAPPGSHYIDQMMSHLGHDYYVGLLSAAAIHGASHQAPMVFQVVTPARLRDRTIGRTKLQFIQRADAAERPRLRHTVPTGRIWVSSPEVTVFDLVEAPERAAGLSNVATIIGDLLHDGMLDPTALADVAAFYPTVVAQRVGHLIDFMSSEENLPIDTDPLHAAVMEGRFRDLSPGSGAGERDNRWRIIVNAEVEHDL